MLNYWLFCHKVNSVPLTKTNPSWTNSRTNPKLYDICTGNLLGQNLIAIDRTESFISASFRVVCESLGFMANPLETIWY